MKQKTREYKTKATQAQADKIELMRDLATYEVNYSNETYLRKTFNTMKDKFIEKKNIFD